MLKSLDRSFREFCLVQFINKHVGARIQLRTVLLGLSQDDLGKLTGSSAIQIQRFEKGFDRVGASKLFELANALRVPVTHFFDGLETPPVQGCSRDGVYTYDKEATILIASYYGVCPKRREEVFVHSVALGKPHTGKLN